MKVSDSSLYPFKDNHCRICLFNYYWFNGVQSFVDTVNKDMYNTDRFSWNSWYYMYCDEEDKIYLSRNLLEIE